MNNTTINGALLKEMFLTGAALLEKNKAYVDSLNVFPVPDGDTGTNMSMTMQSAVKEIKAGYDFHFFHRGMHICSNVIKHVFLHIGSYRFFGEILF